jgi:hypothetical protein
MAIVVYDIPPIAPDPKHTRYIEAGAVKFGLEYRVLDDQELATQYADDPESKAKIDAAKPEDLDDRGVSIHVIDAEDDHEYIRFDVFDNGPHYHYIKKGVIENKIVDFDTVAMGDMLPWALSQLREKLPIMLTHAGGEALASKLEPGLVAAKVAELGELAEQARRAQRGEK